MVIEIYDSFQQLYSKKFDENEILVRALLSQHKGSPMLDVFFNYKYFINSIYQVKITKKTLSSLLPKVFLLLVLKFSFSDLSELID